jgi:hypothetical protein
MLLEPVLSAQGFLAQVDRRDNDTDLLPLGWYQHPLFVVWQLGFDGAESDGIAKLNFAFRGKVNKLAGTCLYREKQGRWAATSSHAGQDMFWIYAFDEDSVHLDKPPVKLKAQKAFVAAILAPEYGELLSLLLEGDTVGILSRPEGMALLEEISVSEDICALFDVPPWMTCPEHAKSLVVRASATLRMVLDPVLRPSHRELYGTTLEGRARPMPKPEPVAHALSTKTEDEAEAELATKCMTSICEMMRVGMDSYAKRIRTKKFRQTAGYRTADVDFEEEYGRVPHHSSTFPVKLKKATSLETSHKLHCVFVPDSFPKKRETNIFIDPPSTP